MSPYEKLLQASEHIAGYWTTTPLTTLAQPDHVRYTNSADIFYDAVTSYEDLPDKLINPSARHGMKVLFRVCHIAAIIGAKSGIDTSELTRILSKPESFTDIAKIASLPNKINKRVEAEFGLLYQYPVYEYYLNLLSLDDDTLQFKDIDFTIARKRLEVEDEHGEQGLLQCSAHRSLVLQGLFHTAVKICSRDSKLFQHTLSKPPLL